MTSIAQQIVDLNRAQPKLTSAEVAAALSVSTTYVRAVSYRRRIFFPSGIKPSLINVLVKALEIVRDADNDCRLNGLQTMPAPARTTIDAALARARGYTP